MVDEVFQALIFSEGSRLCFSYIIDGKRFEENGCIEWKPAKTAFLGEYYEFPGSSMSSSPRPTRSASLAFCARSFDPGSIADE